MEKIVKQALLYDFYGELLTEHQKNIYEDAVYNDMSLSEIAIEQGISRQGVHDLIKRCDKILESYEEKLQLVMKFSQAKDRVSKILELTNKIEEDNIEYSLHKEECIKPVLQIREIASELLNEL